MMQAYIKNILQQLRKGKITTQQAFEKLKLLPYADLSYAKVDTHRTLRRGFPEVIYSPGKTVPQIINIAKKLLKFDNTVIATKATKEVYEEVKKVIKDAEYYEVANLIVVNKKKIKKKNNRNFVLVVTGGTSDMKIAEEAAITCEVLGCNVKRLYDVGVAGVHRLLNNMKLINQAKVIIVVAGMEGALPSVLGGLTDKPIIAVPTSVGYGASFQGLSALLTMLNSCSPGIVVVNIDNGFGAGYFAAMLLKKTF